MDGVKAAGHQHCHRLNINVASTFVDKIEEHIKGIDHISLTK